MGEVVLIDLFSGVGGFALGLKKAGFNITHHYFSEVDKHAIAVYKYRFKEAEYVGSVEHVSGEAIREKHPRARIIVCFGFPCQDLSVAGKRRGLAEGTRSGLLNEAVRIVKEVQPDYYIAENVKGFYSSNSGMDFIIANEFLSYVFSSCPQYTVEQQLLNTSWFIPQNRERNYFVGYPRETGYRQILPLRLSNIKDIQEEAGRDLRERVQAGENGVSRQPGEASENANEHECESEYACDQGGVINNKGNIASIDVSTAIDANYHKGLDNHGQRTHVQSLNGSEINPTIPNGGRGSGTLKHNWDLVEEKTHRAVLTPDRFEKRQNGRRFKEEEEEMFTLNCQDRHGVEEVIKNEMPVANSVTPDAYITTGKRKRDENGKAVLTSMHERRIRRLTEIECNRLQGFPDKWCEFGNYDGEIKPVSSTQQYKQMGNAVSVPVVQAVGRAILNYEDK